MRISGTQDVCRRGVAELGGLAGHAPRCTAQREHGKRLSAVPGGEGAGAGDGPAAQRGESTFARPIEEEKVARRGECACRGAFRGAAVLMRRGKQRNRYVLPPPVSSYVLGALPHRVCFRGAGGGCAGMGGVAPLAGRVGGQRAPPHSAAAPQRGVQARRLAVVARLAGLRWGAHASHRGGLGPLGGTLEAARIWY